MNKRGAAGFIAFGVVFILFLLFMLFRPDTNFITGFATYTYSYDDNPANTIYTGQIINSSVKFTLGVSPANNIYTIQNINWEFILVTTRRQFQV